MTEGSMKYSEGIAAARTLIALKASVAALQRRLPEGREQARNRFTGALGHFHWLSNKEDPAGILGNIATPSWRASRARRPSRKRREAKRASAKRSPQSRRKTR